MGALHILLCQVRQDALRSVARKVEGVKQAMENHKLITVIDVVVLINFVPSFYYNQSRKTNLWRTGERLGPYFSRGSSFIILLKIKLIIKLFPFP